MEDTSGKLYIGERLDAWLEESGKGIQAIADHSGEEVTRQYVYSIIDGKANFTIDKLETILRAAGYSLYDFLVGIRKSDRSPKEELLQSKVSAIVKVGSPDQIAATEFVLAAIADRAATLAKAKARGDPFQEGEGGGQEVQPRRPRNGREKKRKHAG